MNLAMHRRRLRGGDANAPPLDGDLVANYDAMQLSGYAANDPVPVFSDFSGEDNHTDEQSTLAAQATYDPDVDGSGTPGLQFDGGQWYVLPDALKLDPSDPVHVFLVGHRQASGSRAWVSWRGDSGVAGYQILSATNDRSGGSMGSNAVFSPDDTWPEEDRGLVVQTSNGESGDWFLRHDGAQVGSDNNDGADPDMARLALIGARDDGSGTVELRLNGAIQQILFYDGSMSTSEVETVEQWLTDRWGLS